jgi:hypothetical protein
MAHYLVRARLKADLAEELRQRLDRKEFLPTQPFGRALTHALENARWDSEAGEVVWEEEDYCSPPLAMERAAVLDRYCDDLRVERVQEGEGWQRIAHLPSLWDAQPVPDPDKPAIEVLSWGEGQGPVCDWTTGRCAVPEEN